MDVKLENLIEKIKKDGIQEAQKKSQKIIQEAHAQAATIVEEAKKKAKDLLEKQEQANKKRKQDGEAGLQQAARDLILTVREKIVPLVSS